MTDLDHVVLTELELRIGAWIGRLQHEEAARNGCNPGRGPSKQERTPVNHVRGCHTEIAAARALNLYWEPTDKYQHGRRDVGELLEVRSTVLPHGRLIVKPGAVDDDPYVLVRENAIGDYDVLGWRFARAAKQYPLETRYGDAAHYVPQEDLHQLGALRAWIRGKR